MPWDSLQAVDWLALVLVLVPCYLQDVLFTAKVAFVAHERTKSAVGADVLAMLATALYTALTTAAVVHGGASAQSIASFVAIGLGGGTGTMSGMLLSAWLERRWGRRIPHRIRPPLWLPVPHG